MDKARKASSMLKKMMFIFLCLVFLGAGCSKIPVNERILILTSDDLMPCHEEGIVDAVEYFEHLTGTEGLAFEVTTEKRGSDEWNNPGWRSIHVVQVGDVEALTQKPGSVGASYIGKNPDKFIGKIAFTNERCLAPEIYYHELGHALGLRHVSADDDYYNLMNGDNLGRCQGNCYLTNEQIESVTSFINREEITKDANL